MAKSVSIFDGSAWVSIVGPPGVDGKDGKDGSGVDIKGTATTYPPSASPTAGDMWIVADPVPAGFPPGTNPGDGLVWSGTAWNNVGGIRGPAGKDGADGADGAPGQDGQAGADGAPGADGVGFTFRGEWDGSAYAVNDVVTYQGTTYIMIAGSGDEDISDTTAWSVLVPKGADGAAGSDGAPGAPGQGLNFRGEWDPGETYADYDVVTAAGETFLIQGIGTVAKNTGPANLVLLASKGADGTAGANGADGADGAAGADGLSFTYRGDYDADAEYEVGDVIYYPPLKQTLILVSATGKAKRPAPDDRATIWDGVWNTMTVDGRDGADGAKGDTGDDGRSVAVTKSPTQPATAAIGDFWIET